MLAALLLAAQPAAVTALPVIESVFYVDTELPDGFTSEATDRVPLRDGVCYRWLIRTKPRAAVVHVDERLTLPAPAAAWGGVDGNDTSPTRLSADRRVATTSLVLPLTSGALGNRWCVMPGDPAGAYRIEVAVGARTLAAFDFTLVAPDE